MEEITGSKLWLIIFYKEQLEKFKRIGKGKKTEFDVVVTPKLINATEKRLNQLTVVYDGSLTPQTLVTKYRLRRARLKRAKLKDYLDDKTNGNETTTTKKRKDIRTNGHERSKS